MWSLPVTFGGGIEMVKGSGLDTSGLKCPSRSHQVYRRSSDSSGSKFLGSDVFAASPDTARDVRICRARCPRRDAGAENFTAWPAVLGDDIDASECGVIVIIGDRTSLQMHDLADILRENSVQHCPEKKLTAQRNVNVPLLVAEKKL